MILRLILALRHSTLSGRGLYGWPGAVGGSHRRHMLMPGQPSTKISVEKTRITIDIAIWTAMLMRMGIWRKTVGAVRMKFTNS